MEPLGLGANPGQRIYSEYLWNERMNEHNQEVLKLEVQR
jgi:hypothetical protein